MYAIVGADVLTMDERGLLENQTILVREGRIEALGPADSVAYASDDYSEIETPGLFVIPGVVDAHVHLRESREEDLIRYLRAGVTTARDMNGRPRVLGWRDRIASGELPGPTLYVASPSLGNFSSPNEGYPTPKTEEEGRTMVRRFAEAGYDWIKVYSFLPAAGFRGVMQEANRVSLPVGGHVPLEIGMDVLDSGMRSIEHLTEYPDAALSEAGRERADDLRTVFHAGELDTTRLQELSRRTKLAGIWNVPTITWFDRELPTKRALRAWQREELRREGAANRRLIVERLHQAGAKLAMGTDSDGLGEHLSPFAVVDELKAMTEAGLTRLDALHAATVGGAELLGGLEDFGTVAVGKRADILVLLCDPREDLTCLADIEWVMARGRLPVHEVDRRRQEAARTEH